MTSLLVVVALWSVLSAVVAAAFSAVLSGARVLEQQAGRAQARGPVALPVPRDARHDVRTGTLV